MLESIPCGTPPLPIHALPKAQPETPLGAPDTLWPCLPPAWCSVSTFTSCPLQASGAGLLTQMSPQGRRGSRCRPRGFHRPQEGEGRTRASTWRSSIARQREGVAYMVVVGAHAPGPGAYLSQAEPFLFASWY